MTTAFNDNWTAHWVELDEQWQQRSHLMFQRCVHEPDMNQAQLTWDVACHLEKMRLEWKSSCLHKEQRTEAAKAVDGELVLFTQPSASHPHQQ